MEKTRRIISTLLLLVYLAALSCVSFHRHGEGSSDSPECAQCVQHLPHQGHLSAYGGGFTDCVLCQFLTLAWLPALLVVLFPVVLFLVSLAKASKAAVHSEFPWQRTSRAPPAWAQSPAFDMETRDR